MITAVTITDPRQYTGSSDDILAPLLRHLCCHALAMFRLSDANSFLFTNQAALG
jgi:hypothetical protein